MFGLLDVCRKFKRNNWNENILIKRFNSNHLNRVRIQLSKQCTGTHSSFSSLGYSVFFLSAFPYLSLFIGSTSDNWLEKQTPMKTNFHSGRISFFLFSLAVSWLHETIPDTFSKLHIWFVRDTSVDVLLMTS